MELKSMLLIETLRVTLGPFFSLFFRISAEGQDNVPEEGGALLVSNHRCYLDPLVIGYCVDRYINWGAGSHLYGIPGTAPLMNLVGFFPINIYGGTEGDVSVDMGRKLLENGEIVGLFPEGIESFMYIYRESKVSEFKTGFVKMALEARVPVIPVALPAEEEKELIKIPGILVKPFVSHPTAKDGVQLITYRRVKCRIGIPIDLSPYYHEPITKNLMDFIAAKIRRIVIKLYDGEDLDRLLLGKTPFDFTSDKV